MAARLIPALVLAAAASLPATAATPRVVIIGFDGADARLVEQYMAEGRLPNLSRLKEQGSYAQLTPTNPPQTPVSWSAFATGKNPGKTGVFDFLKRSGHNYFPTLAFTTESRRPFLWGPRNAKGLAALGAVVGLLIGVGFPLLFRARRKLVLGLGLLSAAALGWGGHQMGSRWLPEAVPWAVNNRQGRTLWQMAASHGRATQVIRVPQNFPAEPIDQGRVLCGLGVPDMRGRVGTPSFYTSEPGFQVSDNEFSVEVIPLGAKSGRVTSALYGPLNLPFHQYRIDDAKALAATPEERSRISADMERELEEQGIPRRLDLPVSFTVSDDASSVTIEVQGHTTKLRVGEWSDWQVLKFPVNWLVDMAQPLRGIVRWKLLSTRPELKLYLTPVNFHPDCQPIPFSFPGSFAADLQQNLGFFKTLGWAEDTWTLPTGLVPDEFFLEDMTRTVDAFEAMMETQLSGNGDHLYVQVFDFVDRIGHMFWRYLDEQHPFHDPMNDPAHVEAMRGALRSAYERMDRIVGRARELAGEDALFFVMSDHGFGSFRRQMNYNSWLTRNGFMTLKSDRTGKPKTLEDLFETRRFFEEVDWSRTQAYALGLGGIYINVAGREAKGAVQPGEDYERVRSAIIAGLEASVDPDTGERPVQKVYRREEMYTGFDPAVIPDLRVANTLGYRIGWQTALGEVPREIYADNLKAWSGDHCSLDPELVKGILFVNRPISRDDLNIVDVMPTVLKAMEIEIPEDVDGRPFL